jgi:hypothetical protein
MLGDFIDKLEMVFSCIAVFICVSGGFQIWAKCSFRLSLLRGQEASPISVMFQNFNKNLAFGRILGPYQKNERS